MKKALLAWGAMVILNTAFLASVTYYFVKFIIGG